MAEYTLESDIGWLGMLSINSSTGDVIALEKQQGKDVYLLYKYSLQDGSYSNEWTRQSPENKEWSSCYLTDAGDVILQDRSNHRTCLFDQDMQLMDSWQYQGHLRACLPGPRTVYAVTKEEEWVIDIRSRDGEILELKPEGNTWSYYPDSVCEDERTKRLVVVEEHNKQMDIFAQGGKHEKHVSLPYRPRLVCCSADYIFVRGYMAGAVHVHSWIGLHIQTLSHQQLGVREDSSISAIQCNNDGTVLQLVTRDTLHAYKVHLEYNPEKMSPAERQHLVEKALDRQKQEEKQRRQEKAKQRSQEQAKQRRQEKAERRVREAEQHRQEEERLRQQEAEVHQECNPEKMSAAETQHLVEGTLDRQKQEEAEQRRQEAEQHRQGEAEEHRQGEAEQHRQGEAEQHRQAAEQSRQQEAELYQRWEVEQHHQREVEVPNVIEARRHQWWDVEQRQQWGAEQQQRWEAEQPQWWQAEQQQRWEAQQRQQWEAQQRQQWEAEQRQQWEAEQQQRQEAEQRERWEAEQQQGQPVEQHQQDEAPQ